MHEQGPASERTLERALVERAIARDERALAELYSTHAPGIHRFLRDLLSDTTSAADATQETFVRAFRRLDTLRDTGRVAPWLFGIARNVSLEYRKSRRRSGRVFAISEAELRDPADERHSPEAELIERETVRAVGEALSTLSDDRKAMLLMRLDHGLAYEDIAKSMGFSLAKVKVEIHRARLALRAKLDPEEPRSGHKVQDGAQNNGHRAREGGAR